MRLLLTRPEPDAARTAATLRARGHVVLCAPLLRIETIAPADFGSGPHAAVVMTSANAARAVAGHPALARLRALPLFAVGRHTADAAREIGFADIRSADGAADDLLVHLRRDLPAGASILYLAGENRARDLAAALTGHAVQTVIVYRAKAVAAFPDDALAALRAQALDAVVHFSRRSAAIYVECAKAAGVLDRALPLVHYCLSSQAAEPVVTAGAGRVRIAAHPDEAAMLELVERN